MSPDGCVSRGVEADRTAAGCTRSTFSESRGDFIEAERSYSVAHAQFVWDIKTEPGIVSLFEEIWGTDKLTVSFGACAPTQP